MSSGISSSIDEGSFSSSYSLLPLQTSSGTSTEEIEKIVDYTLSYSMSSGRSSIIEEGTSSLSSSIIEEGSSSSSSSIEEGRAVDSSPSSSTGQANWCRRQAKLCGRNVTNLKEALCKPNVKAAACCVSLFSVAFFIGAVYINERLKLGSGLY